MIEADAREYLTRLAPPDAPGICVSVLGGCETIFAFAGGLANLEAGMPWRADTCAAVASHTKCLTAYIAAQLHASGAIDLDAAIATALSDLPETWRAVTLRQCLSNISGLPFDEQIAFLLGRDWRTPTSCGWLHRISASAPVLHVPGAAFLYNDTNFRLAVRVLESVTGLSFEGLAKRHVFDAYDMPGSTIVRHGSETSHALATTYERTPSGFDRHIPYMELSGDGAFVSTMNDMRRWSSALLAMARENDPALISMRTPGVLHDGTETNYGLGLSLGHHRGHSWFGHSGAGAGYATAWIAPDANLAIVVMSNRADIDPMTVACDVADFWLGSDGPASARAAFAGRPPAEARDFVAPAGGITVRLEQRGDVIRIDALGDYAFLREREPNVWMTEDGRLNGVLDLRHRTRLLADGEAFVLEAVTWSKPAPDALETFDGRYSGSSAGMFLEVADGELCIAGGPDAKWRFPIDDSGIGVFRAGPYALSMRDNGIALRGRGLPVLMFRGAA